LTCTLRFSVGVRPPRRDTVREHLAFLKEWIDARLADLANGKTANPEKTFAHYWIKNGGEGENFAHKDVVFEVFHNFVALSQWGNTMYNIMLRLAKVGFARMV
jgi:hypothetical protein